MLFLCIPSDRDPFHFLISPWIHAFQLLWRTLWITDSERKQRMERNCPGTNTTMAFPRSAFGLWCSNLARLLAVYNTAASTQTYRVNFVVSVPQILLFFDFCKLIFNSLLLVENNATVPGASRFANLCWIYWCCKSSQQMNIWHWSA